MIPCIATIWNYNYYNVVTFSDIALRYFCTRGLFFTWWTNYSLESREKECGKNPVQNPAKIKTAKKIKLFSER